MSYSALSRDALDPATPPHTRRNAESPPPRSPRSPRSLLRSERRGLLAVDSSASASPQQSPAHSPSLLLDLRGTLQHTSGVSRAGVGRPNLDEWTPAEYYTPDCLHPSEAGFRHLFRELARTLEAG